MSAKEGDEFNTSDTHSIGIPYVNVPDTDNQTEPIMKELLTDPMGDPLWPDYGDHAKPEGGSTDGAHDVAVDSMDNYPLFDDEEIKSEHGDAYKKFVDGGNFDLNEGEERPKLTTSGEHNATYDINVGETRQDNSNAVVDPQDTITADETKDDSPVSREGVYDKPLGDALNQDDGKFDVDVGEERPKEEGA